jgi:hypothetical protein
VAETQQYTVQATVPPTAAPGTYLFRLDMVGEDRPNEDYTQGPSIALTVPAAVPAPRFPLWLLVVAAVVVLVLGGVIVALVLRGTGETVPMPNVVGKTRPEAEKLLTDAGLKVGTITRDATQNGTPDTVLDQEPPPGTATPRGNGITLIIEAQVQARDSLRLPLRDGEGADLDDGRLGARSEADLQLDLTLGPGPLVLNKPPLILVRNGTLTAQNGARFAKVGNAFVGLRACDAALKASSVSSIPLQDLPRGTRVCVLTNEKRVSLLQIDQAVALNQGVESTVPFSMQFITWVP